MKKITIRSAQQIYYFVEKVTRGCKTQKGMVEKFVKGTNLSYWTTYYMMFDPKRLFTKGQIMKFCTHVGLAPDPANLLVQSFKDDGRFLEKLPGYIYNEIRIKKQASTQEVSMSKQGVSMSKVRKTRNPATSSGKIVSKAVLEKYPDLIQPEAWKKLSKESDVSVGTFKRATYPSALHPFKIGTARKVTRALDLDETEYFKAAKADNVLKSIPDSIQPSLPFDEKEIKINVQDYGLIKQMGALENSIAKKDFLGSTEISIGICETISEGNGYINPWLKKELEDSKRKLAVFKMK